MFWYFENTFLTLGNDFRCLLVSSSQEIPDLCLGVGCFTRHFSYVTKSRIFKNLNLRKRADRNFCNNALKSHFRHLKSYSNPPSWFIRSCCHMDTFWKTKYWNYHFWEGQPFRFRYVEVHCQTRCKSMKTGISF